MENVLKLFVLCLSFIVALGSLIIMSTNIVAGFIVLAFSALFFVSLWTFAEVLEVLKEIRVILLRNENGDSELPKI